MVSYYYLLHVLLHVLVEECDINSTSFTDISGTRQLKIEGIEFGWKVCLRGKWIEENAMIES